MIAVFFGESGHVASVPLQERKTVDAERYINTSLPKAFEDWSPRRSNTGNRGLLLHNDNESDHTDAASLDYMEENRVQLFYTHFPIPPDVHRRQCITLVWIANSMVLVTSCGHQGVSDG